MMDTATLNLLNAAEASYAANTAGYHARSKAGHTASKNLIVAADLPGPLAVTKAEDMSALEPLTVFHSRATIPMTLADLAKVMARATKSTDEVALIAVVLMSRYAKHTVPVTRHMMHRLYVAALQVALKTHNDEFYTNAAYARAAGVSLAEMNRLEMQLMFGLNWNCCVLLNPSSAAATSDAAKREALLNLAATSLRTAPEVREVMPPATVATSMIRVANVVDDSPIVCGASLSSVDASSPTQLPAPMADRSEVYPLPSPIGHSASNSRLLP